MKGEGCRPKVWYMATGYLLPAGIEAHLLHYASEMRRHGFDTQVLVFKRLPPQPHRFLLALRERGIPIRSLCAMAWRRARVLQICLQVPWYLYIALVKRRRPVRAAFRIWAERIETLRELQARLRAEPPDLIHIFGRLPATAWAKLPAARTVYHDMMTGTVDDHWTPGELAEFRAFAERAARCFVPGAGVAANLKREFGIRRRVDPIFTMCPDECGASGDECRGTPEGEHPLRFGVICRLTGQKGITYLLEALQQYRDRHGEVDFTFGGVGPMESRIREFVERHGLRNVRIVRVSSAAEILGDLDLFVHPSVDDAMPMSLAEALMCGVPCLCCPVGGVPDLIRDGVEGFLVEPRRPDLILAGMERFGALSAEERAGFRQRARRRYEEVCRPESVGREVARHYGEILEQVGGGNG